MDGWVVFLIYSAWAIYSGYKMVNGRYEWLEKKDTANRICKVIAILGAGYVIGAFYLCWLAIKIAFRVADGFK